MSHIALIFGGPSAEHDVSLVSAKNIYQVLKTLDHTTFCLGITRAGQWKLITGEELSSTSFQQVLNLEQAGQAIELTSEQGQCYFRNLQSNEMQALDVAFPIIHGTYGEDGKLQKELKAKGLPFVGTDVEGCQVSFDKGLTKLALAKASIPQVPYLSFEGENHPTWQELTTFLGEPPYFIKPANMGSSIGISKVKDLSSYDAALVEAHKHDGKIVIEKGIRPRELECALLETPDGLQVTGLGEVVPRHEFYSYEAKYLDANGADIVIPAVVDPSVTTAIQEMALRAFRALQCRDYARADFFMDESGNLYFNEINTHPGFTNISQFPMLWKQEGMSYAALITHLIQRALQRT